MLNSTHHGDANKKHAQGLRVQHRSQTLTEWIHYKQSVPYNTGRNVRYPNHFKKRLGVLQKANIELLGSSNMLTPQKPAHEYSR